MGLDQFLVIETPAGLKMPLWDPRSAPTEEVTMMIQTEEGFKFQTRPKGKPTNTWRNWYELHEWMTSKMADGDDSLILNANLLSDLEAWFRSQDSMYDAPDGSDDDDADVHLYYRLHNRRILEIAHRVLLKGGQVRYWSWD